MRSRIKGVQALTVFLVACLDSAATQTPIPGPPPPPTIQRPTDRAARTSVAAAMHLHGLSNHGANSRPASIAWHTQQYAAAGVELMWWTDHSDSYFGRVPDFRVVPIPPAPVEPGIWKVGVWGPGNTAYAFLHSSAVPIVDSTAAKIRIPVPAGDSTQSDTVTLYFGVLEGNHPRSAYFGVLARSLLGGPRFAMTVNRIAGGDYPRVRVIVPLAWHPRDQSGYRQILRYDFGMGSDSMVRAEGDTLVLRRAVAGPDSAVIALEPALDAVHLPDGLDNTTDEYRIELIVPRGASDRELSFGFPVVANSKSTAAVVMPPAVQIAHELASAYGVRTIWGLEVPSVPGAIANTKWLDVIGAGRHLVILLPDDVQPSLEALVRGDAGNIGQLAASLGGLTSIAHPFGTSTGAPIGTESQQRQEARDLGAFLVQQEGWHAGLIEVGTTRRGLVGLRAHLDLLDYLWSSGIRLCGVAVTDSHGGYVLSDPIPGSEDQYNWVTWMGGVDRFSSGPNLIAALRSCNVSFGDPFYTRGGLWGEVKRDSVGHQTLTFDARGLSPSAELFLYEAVIDSTGTGHDPAYRSYQTPVQRSDTIAVGGCQPGYVRIEAWAGGRPIAFTNPMALTADSSRCPNGTS
jgi:hypothetical protein